MNSKKSLLNLEMLLGGTVLAMVVGMKITFLSPIGIIRGISFLYVIAAVAMMLVIVFRLSKDDVPVEEKNEDDARQDISRLCQLGREKNLTKYSETARIQLEKLDKRADMLENMLKENFDSDSRSTEMYSFIEQYKSVFYKNIHKMLKRMEIMDTTGMSVGMSVDASLKQEAKTIYAEHVAYIESKINANAEINLQLDKLMTEISRINDSEGENDLEPLEDYIKALRKLNDETQNQGTFSNAESNDEINKLMQKY